MYVCIKCGGKEQGLYIYISIASSQHLCSICPYQCDRISMSWLKVSTSRQFGAVSVLIRVTTHACGLGNISMLERENACARARPWEGSSTF